MEAWVKGGNLVLWNPKAYSDQPLLYAGGNQVPVQSNLRFWVVVGLNPISIAHLHIILCSMRLWSNLVLFITAVYKIAPREGDSSNQTVARLHQELLSTRTCHCVKSGVLEVLLVSTGMLWSDEQVYLDPVSRL